MQITERAIGDVTILDLDGKLTIDDGAELLRDKVASIVFQGRRKVLLNLAGVPYMDSGGLGELVRCSMVTRRAGGAVKLVGLTSRITDLLAITKLLTIFDTFDSEALALAGFGDATPLGSAVDVATAS
jgi:anti-sigma B factor antagonist